MIPMMWWGMPGFPWLLPVLLLLAAGAVVLVMAGNRGVTRSAPAPESAEELLRRRYAAGEIDAEEYRERLATLRAGARSAP